MLEGIKRIFGVRSRSRTAQQQRTRLLVKYNAGFKNNLYIRGRGAGLSWDRGVLLQNIAADEWVWEPTMPFTECEFKVLLNDEKYEVGENHRITGGKLYQYTPHF